MGNKDLEIAIQEIKANWEKNQNGKKMKELREKKRKYEDLLIPAELQASYFEVRNNRNIKWKIERIDDAIMHLDSQLWSIINRKKEQMCEHSWKERENFFSDYKECKKCGLIKKTFDYDPGYK